MTETSKLGQNEITNNASGNVPGTGLLTKSLDIIQYIGETDRRLKFKDIATRTGFSKSTLYRILTALASRGFIAMDRRDQSYILGPKFTSLASSVGRNSELIAMSCATLRNIADTFGESVNLAVMNGDVQQVIARWEGRGTRTLASALGEIKPLYCTSLGKSLLAFQPEDVRDRLVSRIEFTRYTENTIMSVAHLRAEMEMIRARGFAIDDHEIIVGVRCVSVPILDLAGFSVASISVTGPAYRMTNARIRELAAVIQRASRQISQGLLASRPGPQLVEGENFLGTSLRIFDVQSFNVQAMVFDPKRTVLFWIDEPGACVCRLADGRREVVAWFDVPVSGLALTADGAQLLTVTERAIWCVDADASDTIPTRIMEVDPIKGVRNIVTTDSGKMVIALKNPSGCGTIMIVDRQGDIKALDVEIAGNVGIFRGVERGVVHAICRTSGQILSLDMTANEPVPDFRHGALDDPVSLTDVMVDSEGDVWVSRGSTWNVTCHAADGLLKGMAPLPVPTPTAFAFDPHSRTVFIGSDRIGISPNLLELAPLAGGIIALAKPF